MKISDLIAALQAAQTKVGDVPVSLPDAMEVLDLVVHEDTVIISDYNEDGLVRNYLDPAGVFRDDEEEEDAEDEG